MTTQENSIESIEHMTKEQWLIRLMQGMTGDYGASKKFPMECYYNAYTGRFEKSDQRCRVYPINVNDLPIDSNYWIFDTKCMEVQPINLHNID